MYRVWHVRGQASRAACITHLEMVHVFRKRTVHGPRSRNNAQCLHGRQQGVWLITQYQRKTRHMDMDMGCFVIAPQPWVDRGGAQDG